ncbi:hypothetical protein GCM10023152_10590 [Agromyces bauzanensis]|uniref:Uncharacterized protein n=1 Tax=Agromyces bauzanensis TaxID=1308924 RepID=A0A917UMI3_9MICO|nr:hypothetical protein GCM10011372_02340 [Agromyces bauzanensis]
MHVAFGGVGGRGKERGAGREGGDEACEREDMDPGRHCPFAAAPRNGGIGMPRRGVTGGRRARPP